MKNTPEASQASPVNTKSKKQQSLVTAKSVLNLIVQHKTLADPNAYAVWYSYATNQNPELVATIDEILSQKSVINSAEMIQLHTDFIQRDVEQEQNLEDISRSIQTEMAGAASLVGKMISNTDGYVASIDEANKQLSTANAPDEIQSEVDKILEKGKSSQQSAQGYQVELQKKQDEISHLGSRVLQLRDNLMRDSLTELFTRKRFESLLKTRFDEAVSNGYSMTVLVVKLRNIDALNEGARTDISEFIVSSFSGILRKCVGENGACARFSGASFAVLLPKYSYANTAAITNAIIDELDLFKVVKKQSGEAVGHIRCDIGGASMRTGLQPNDLLSIAANIAEQAPDVDRSTVRYDLSRQSAA